MIVPQKPEAPPKTQPLRGRDLASLISATRLSTAIAVLVFVGFGVASAVLLGHIHGAPWLTFVVLAGALFFAR